MKHRIYNLLKTLNRLIFPGTGAIYYGLSKIYTMPNEGQVIGIFIVLSAISGVIIQFMSRKYEPRVIFQGEMVISETPEGKRTFSLELSRSPEDLAHMESITFKVVNPQD